MLGPLQQLTERLISMSWGVDWKGETACLEIGGRIATTTRPCNFVLGLLWAALFVTMYLQV